MKWLRNGSSMLDIDTPPTHKGNHKEKNEETKGGGGERWSTEIKAESMWCGKKSEIRWTFASVLQRKELEDESWWEDRGSGREPSACSTKQLYWNYSLFCYDSCYNTVTCWPCVLLPNNPTIDYSICFLSHMNLYFFFLGPFAKLFFPCRLTEWKRDKKTKHCRQTVMNKSVPTYPLPSPHSQAKPESQWQILHSPRQEKALSSSFTSFSREVLWESAGGSRRSAGQG